MVLGITSMKGWTEEANSPEKKTKVRQGEDQKGHTEKPKGWSDL